MELFIYQNFDFVYATHTYIFVCACVCMQVELHVHADGSCRLSTLQDLSRQFKCPYAHDDLEAFKKTVTLSQSTTSSLQHFLQVFGAITDILK